ncbi:MAG: type 4a pilus biogenesis protein PilO [Candidatus Eisenbacteria bacterium]
MDTTGGIERRPADEGAARPDKLDAVSLDPIAETAGADDIEVIGAASSVAGSAAGDSESDAPVAAGGLTKVRGMLQFKVDAASLKASWRANSIGRVALLAVCGYALCVGAAYFFLMQPLGTNLHKVKEQKSILHDYAVIQQAGAAIGSFKDGLMTGDQRLTVMSEVNQMAERSGVKIVGDPDLLLRRDISSDFVEYPVRLRVRGTFHEMGNFLSLLESSARFVLVEEVEIRSEVGSRDRDSEATVLLALAAWEG